MLLGRPDTLLYLTRSGFKFFSKNFPKGVALALPHNAVNDLEVVSQDKLKEQIEAFIVENKISPSSAAILLSEEIIFTKNVSLDKKKEDLEVKEFLDEVPFDSKELTYQIKPGIKNSLVVATNSHLFLALKDVLESKGWRVELVVADVGEVPTAANWLKVFNKVLKFSHYNFLKNKNILSDVPVVSVSVTHRRRWFLWTMVLIVLIASAIVAVVYFKIKLK
jgi:hypothetical protein